MNPVMLQRVVLGGAVALALAILAFLLVKTQAQPLDLSRYKDRLTEVDRVIQLETDLDQQIVQSQLAMEAEPATLAQAQERLVAARQALKQAWLPSQRLAPEIDKEIRDYFRQADARSNALKNYQADLRSFVNAFEQLRQQVDAVMPKLSAPGEQPLRQQLSTLIGKLATYITAPTPENGAEVARIQGTIGTAARQARAEEVSEVDRVLRSADTVRTAKDRMQASLETLKAVPAMPALKRSQEAFFRHYTAAEMSLARYRLVLVLYASILLGVVGVVGWRLKNAYAEQDRINAQLHDANVNLEKQVQARTADLRKALDELRANQGQLIQSEKMASLGQLVAGVAHEINTPLGYARSNVETIRETLSSLTDLLQAYEATLNAVASGNMEQAQLDELEQARQAWNPAETTVEVDALLADAEHGLQQITELVMSLKDFSRVDRSQTEPFDVNSGLESSLKICHGKLKHRIEVHRDFAELPKVLCAPSQLNQVFLNLITNAAQAISGEGQIGIRTRDLGGKVEVVVTDSGCGMDEKTQARIFEPFFTTKPVGSGTGLGLSIVYRIIEDHGGSIKVASTPGKGSEFTIVLPTRPPKKGSEAAPRETMEAGVAV
jgi:signal transduction histidine kinase